MVLEIVEKMSKLRLGGVLGRSWELLGCPWGLKVDSREDFDGFLEHFTLPCWMFFGSKIVVFSNLFFDHVFCGFGYRFWSIFRLTVVDFWMKKGV